MKRINLLKITALAVLGMFSNSSVMAQTPMKESIATNLGGTRFVITAPTSIVGIKKINYAPWGAAASPTISNVTVEKAFDTLGAATLLNGTGAYPSLTGKFALIFRGGGITFSDKVNRCITAGAVGVIIVNNIPGDPVGMAPTPAGSTVAIPVLMISDVDGQAISDVIKSAAPGSGIVKLTLGTWNTGGTHDLGILAPFQAVPHALNMPLHQFAGSAGVQAYKMYTGGAIANYGTSTETAVTVNDSIYWTPTGGTASFVSVQSYTVPSISVLDSIRFGFASAPYSLPSLPTVTGKYEHKYSIQYSFADDFPQDNTTTITHYVNDSIFCRGNYDYANSRPRVSIGIQPGGGTTNFLMGNMYYVKNGGYAARSMQFSLSVNDVPTLSALTTATIFLYKWKDGTAGAGSLDSFVQAGELTPVGVNVKNFTTADSSGRTITLDIKDIIDPASSKLVILEDTTWYYAVVEVPVTSFIGMDESINFFSRSYAQYKNLGSKDGAGIIDNAIGAFFNDNGNFNSTATNTAFPFPFAASATVPSNVFHVDSVFYDKADMVPAIALITSKQKKSASISGIVKSIGSTTIYPNPATKGSMTVNIALENNSNSVVYRLTDAIGRTMYTETHKNVLKEQFEMNTANYPTGNYFLMIITDNGFDVKKVTIQN
jgi:hypothetical protein